MDCWQDTESRKLYCSLGPFCTKITEAEVRLHNFKVQIAHNQQLFQLLEGVFAVLQCPVREKLIHHLQEAKSSHKV